MQIPGKAQSSGGSLNNNKFKMADHSVLKSDSDFLGFNSTASPSNVAHHADDNFSDVDVSSVD